MKFLYRMSKSLELASWRNLAKNLSLRSDVEAEATMLRLQRLLISSGRSFLCHTYSEADAAVAEAILQQKTLLSTVNQYPDVSRWLFTTLNRMGKASAASSLISFKPTLFPISSPVGVTSSVSSTSSSTKSASSQPATTAAKVVDPTPSEGKKPVAAEKVSDDATSEQLDPSKLGSFSFFSYYMCCVSSFVFFLPMCKLFSSSRFACGADNQVLESS